MRFEQAQEYILDKLERELPETLYYHNLQHTLEVHMAVQYLSDMENITTDSALLLRTAALYHDAGFIENYNNNEPIAAELAKNTLPGFGYSEGEVKAIVRYILATALKSRPKDRLEEIIRDADYYSFAREDFHQISLSLWKELCENGYSCTGEEWDVIQLEFLSNHRYYTPTARREWGPVKEKHLNQVRKRVEQQQ